KPPTASLPQTSSPALDQPAGGRASPAPTVVPPPFPPYAVLALACRGLVCTPTAVVAPPSDSFFHHPSKGVKGGSKRRGFFRRGVTCPGVDHHLSHVHSPPV